MALVAPVPVTARQGTLAIGLVACASATYATQEVDAKHVSYRARVVYFILNIAVLRDFSIRYSMLRSVS